MSSLGEQKDNLERLLENCEEDKVRLAERNAKLVASGTCKVSKYRLN